MTVESISLSLTTCFSKNDVCAQERWWGHIVTFEKYSGRRLM